MNNARKRRLAGNHNKLRVEPLEARRLLAVSPNQFAPEVSIQSVDGTEVLGIDDVMFNASATDVEDGNISDNISWTSSKDGFLGVGGSALAPLSAGEHTITALATDSGGLTSSDAILVNVPVSQVGVAIEGSVWDTPQIHLREGTNIASRSADRLIVSYAAPPDTPPAIALSSSSGSATFFLTFWDGKVAHFQSLSPLSSGDYTASFSTPDSVTNVNFRISNGTSNSAVPAAAADNVFADVSEGSAPAEEVIPALLGDANGDGRVDFGDFAALSLNFGRTDAALSDGDFNGDGRVDFADFAVIATNFGSVAGG